MVSTPPDDPARVHWHSGKSEDTGFLVFEARGPGFDSQTQHLSSCCTAAQLHLTCTNHLYT